MKFLAVFACLMAARADEGRVPVIVELFTSEGCSSCPPADSLLSTLERSQPIEGVRVIALEEHVDYWDQLGWPDRYASPFFRLRQNEYAQFLHKSDIYTPQAVVNGTAELLGSDGPQLASAIRKNAQSPRTEITLEAVPNPGKSELVDLLVRLAPKRNAPPADVFLAVTEEGLSTQVPRGENAGRKLAHASVVRSFGVIGGVGGEAAGLRPTLKLPKEWRRENLRAVVFVQERSTHRIVGAAMADLRELR